MSSHPPAMSSHPHAMSSDPPAMSSHPPAMSSHPPAMSSHPPACSPRREFIRAELAAALQQPHTHTQTICGRFLVGTSVLASTRQNPRRLWRGPHPAGRCAATWSAPGHLPAAAPHQPSPAAR
eukprot:266451-Chlamydomonas_euryale.AAC.1